MLCQKSYLKIKTRTNEFEIMMVQTTKSSNNTIVQLSISLQLGSKIRKIVNELTSKTGKRAKNEFFAVVTLF